MVKSKLTFFLITIGIIGTVAAMTLPVLIQNYKKLETSARLKKFYSTISQTILISEIDNGPCKNWDKTAQIKDDNGNKSYEKNRNEALTYFYKYIEPYIKILNVEKNPEDLQDEDGQALYFRVYFSDGSYFNMQNGACIDLDFDVNGKREPNTYGKDIFKFIICSETDSSGENRAIKECGENKYWCPYYGSHTTEISREQALTKCKNNPNTCATLIFMDNWEFRDDYPYKL